MEQLLKLQHTCPHPEKSKQLLEAYKCNKCSNVYSLLRCMLCNQWFSHCKSCTDGKMMAWI